MQGHGDHWAVIDENIDFDIFVTGGMIAECRVPAPGDDIRGALWLQGRLSESRPQLLADG